MFKAPKIEDCLQDLIGWKDHYDLNEVPALQVEKIIGQDPTTGEPVTEMQSLSVCDSGEYYNDKHPALRLDIIQSCLPQNRNLSEYLLDKVRIGSTELVNQIVSERKYQNYSKSLLNDQTLFNGIGWSKDSIHKESRFVGLTLFPKMTEGLILKLNSIGLQFTKPQTDLDIYIYHSSKLEPVHTFKFNSTFGVEMLWCDLDLYLKSIDEDISGGFFVIGYYEDDIIGESINYAKMDWNKGFCKSCDGGHTQKNWEKLNEHYKVMPIYVSNSDTNSDRKMMDSDDMKGHSSHNFGINLRVTAECDITDFLCRNRNTLKTALYLKVAHLILKDMQYSMQTNRVEEDIKMMIIRDLEGDKDTNYINLVDSLKKEIQNVNFDHSNIALPCLPCERTNGIKYSAL